MLTVAWQKGSTSKATSYSQTSRTCSGGALCGFSVLGHHDLVGGNTMTGSSGIQVAGRIGCKDRERLDDFLSGSTACGKARRCTFNLQIIQTLPFFPSKLPSANVSAMPRRETP